MNTEILISQAAEAIKMFEIDHDGACCLTVKNGFVTGVSPSEVTGYHPKSLRIERYEFISGVTSSRWNRIGRDLFIFYNEEKKWQEHQKP